ncbi:MULTISPECIES: hypothetical protein [Paraburkholderia]|jgi:hypothetical protein|uniref:hypothetical protein n=1 Tax=Paraburkholderia TaxID=1822464 RepID=UPI0038BA1FA1
MSVTELLQLLREADPDAKVMLVPHGYSAADSQEVRGVLPASDRWTHEQGIDKGRPYEFLYPGEPHLDPRNSCEQITYENVVIVLLAADEGILGSTRVR